MRFAIAFGFSLLLFGCDAGPQPALLNNPAGNEITLLGIPNVPHDGETVSGSVAFEGRIMPLPPGLWTVTAGLGLNLKGIGLYDVTIGLVRHDGPTLLGVIVVNANVQPLPDEAPENAACTSSDVIWNDIRPANLNGFRDCSAITFGRTSSWLLRPTSINFRIVQGLEAANIAVPDTTLIATTFERAGRWTLTEAVWANPDNAGIKPDAKKLRSTSSWMPFNLAKDPRKVTFLNQMKARTESVRAALRQQVDTLKAQNPS